MPLSNRANGVLGIVAPFAALVALFLTLFTPKAIWFVLLLYPAGLALGFYFFQKTVRPFSLAVLLYFPVMMAVLWVFTLTMSYLFQIPLG